MKTIVQLLLVAAVLNAAGHAAYAQWRHYEFKDALHQEVVYSDSRFTPDALQKRVMEMAREYEIPLDSDAVEVKRDGLRTQVLASYTEQVALVPRLYEPMWTFDASIDVRAVH